PSTYAANNFANAVTDAGRPDPAQGSLNRRSPAPEPVSTAPRRRPGSDGGLAPAVRRTVTLRSAAKPAADESLAGVRQRPTTSRPSTSPVYGGVSPAWAMSRGLLPSQPRPKAPTPVKPADSNPAPTRVPAENMLAAAVRAAPPGPARQEPIATPAAKPPSAVPSAPLAQPQPMPAEVRIAALEPSRAAPQAQPGFEAPAAEIRIAAAEPSAPPPQAEAVPTGSRLADLSATLADIAEPEAAPARTAAAKTRPAAKPQSAQRAAATPPAKKPKAEPVEPSRIWVQIAGGAVKGALPREYARLKAKAPKVLGPHGAWSTPLNATNRLLVGPFAGAKEAQAFVNQLKSEKLSGFAWTSPAGQKVEKLPAK
ncbi:MAG: SPOR domain-containing protein, partial [Allosphingosinicella sp.]